MQAEVSNAPRSIVETEVLRIRELLQQNQFAAALKIAEALAVRVPENRDVLYMMAVSQRSLQKIPEAIATLQRLEQCHPTFSRLFQERGHCYNVLRSAPKAIEAFLRAVNLNAALTTSWRALQSLYQMTGQSNNAAMAAAQVATHAQLPSEIVSATALFADGALDTAEGIVRAYLIRHGNHIEGMRLLARIGIERDVLDNVEALLAAVLAQAPDYHAARYDYALVLLRYLKHPQAAAELEKLLQSDPDNRNYRTTYAEAIVGLGNHERALQLYQELLVDQPEAADLHLSAAHALKALGRQEEAIKSYRTAMLVRPGYGEAYWSLANLKTYRFAEQETERMCAEEQAKTTVLADRYHLCFALGKAFEDRNDFARSYSYYERGNALKKSESRYRPEPVERNTRLQKEICTAEFFAARQGVGCDNADPIFILGLPRSGSTLIEQILASHSKVEGTMELADIPRMVLELRGWEPDSQNPPYPRVLQELKSEDFLRLGQKYINDTRVYRTSKPYFIDKMPNNFRHIGLIHLILPNAKIIDARRNAMACCFSNFKQLFAAGQEFTYSLEDIGRYYRTYIELMEHWDSVLPGKVLRVDHEDVVDNLEVNIRRILDFCGLEFEPQCVEFYKTERSIRTASSEQVRRPIFKEGIDQWRNFEPWLEPLRAVLGPLA